MFNSSDHEDDKQIRVEVVDNTPYVLYMILFLFFLLLDVLCDSDNLLWNQDMAGKYVFYMTYYEVTPSKQGNQKKIKK